MKNFFQVENEELKNKDDFTVILQTFTKEFKFPVNQFNTTDLSYLASDCFHFSQKGYVRGEIIILMQLIILDSKSNQTICS